MIQDESVRLLSLALVSRQQRGRQSMHSAGELMKSLPPKGRREPVRASALTTAFPATHPISFILLLYIRPSLIPSRSRYASERRTDIKKKKTVH
jgi:hypothetical protein